MNYCIPGNLVAGGVVDAVPAVGLHASLLAAEPELGVLLFPPRQRPIRTSTIAIGQWSIREPLKGYYSHLRLFVPLVLLPSLPSLLLASAAHVLVVEEVYGVCLPLPELLDLVQHVPLLLLPLELHLHLDLLAEAAKVAQLPDLLHALLERLLGHQFRPDLCKGRAGRRNLILNLELFFGEMREKIEFSFDFNI